MEVASPHVSCQVDQSVLRERNRPAKRRGERWGVYGMHMAKLQLITSTSKFPWSPKLVYTGLLSLVTKEAPMQEGRGWTGALILQAKG